MYKRIQNSRGIIQNMYEPHHWTSQKVNEKFAKFLDSITLLDIMYYSWQRKWEEKCLAMNSQPIFCRPLLCRVWINSLDACNACRTEKRSAGFIAESLCHQKTYFSFKLKWFVSHGEACTTALGPMPTVTQTFSTIYSQSLTSSQQYTSSWSKAERNDGDVD